MSDAKSEYIKQWRKTERGKESQQKQMKRDRARRTAMTALIRLHPDEWEVLFRNALKNEGLTLEKYPL